MFDMKKLLFVIFLMSFSAAGLSAVDYDITSFGAKSKNGVLNTAKIQAAIDRCSSEGGGRVVVPRGEFMTGTISLKNNVTLHLEHGAKLVGSTERKDYTKNLIRAVGVSNIGITGNGVIDGSGWAFWKITGNGNYDHDRPVPGNMVYFEDCDNITIRDVRLQNSESWTVHLLGCTKAFINGVTIRNPMHGPNNDGIDIQGSRDVIISDCDIYTSDDAIVLKNRHSGYYLRPCSNITVTNCILTCYCNALKIGTETIGNFSNITFSNCTVRAALPTDSLARVRYNEVKMPIKAISGISIESVDGSIIDGVSITNIAMEEVRVPIFIRLGNRGAGKQMVSPSRAGEIRNVVISNVTAQKAWYASSITGIPGSDVRNVILSNIIVNMEGGGDESLAEKLVEEKIDAYPDAHMWKHLPASAFYVRHVRDLDMNCIMCNIDAPDKRPVMIFDDVKSLYVNGLSTNDNPNGNASLRLVNTADVRFTALDLSENTKNDIEIRTDEKNETFDVPADSCCFVR